MKASKPTRSNLHRLTRVVRKLSGLIAVAVFAAQPIQARSYEDEELEIFQSVLAKLVRGASPDQAGDRMICAYSIMRTGGDNYQRNLANDTKRKSTNKWENNYNKLSHKHLRSRRRPPITDRIFSRDEIPGSNVIDLRSCDKYAMISINRPLIKDDVAFTRVSYDGFCHSTDYRIALVQRAEKWTVVGQRSDGSQIPMICPSTAERTRNRVRKQPIEILIFRGDGQ